MLVFLEIPLILVSYVASDAARVDGQQGMVWLWSCRQEGGLCMEKHTDGFRPMKPELFHVDVMSIAPTTPRGAVLCCADDVL